MKIATFNVNSIRARMPIVIDWLREGGCDVLCIQETKVQDTDFPTEEFDRLGLEYVFRGQKKYNGVAIFSNRPIENVKYGFDDEPSGDTRLISAKVSGVNIVNTYIPQGVSPESEKFAEKLLWFERLGDFFQCNYCSTEKIVWVGDFNTAPEPIDVYDPKALAGHVCFHPKVNEELAEVMNFGFVDVFRKHCKEPGQYSFWDYRDRGALSRNRGWRLDHIMATEVMATRSVACYIDKKPRFFLRPSDHTPVVAEFSGID